MFFSQERVYYVSSQIKNKLVERIRTLQRLLIDFRQQVTTSTHKHNIHRGRMCCDWFLLLSPVQRESAAPGAECRASLCITACCGSAGAEGRRISYMGEQLPASHFDRQPASPSRSAAACLTAGTTGTEEWVLLDSTASINCWSTFPLTTVPCSTLALCICFHKENKCFSVETFVCSDMFVACLQYEQFIV